MNFRLKRLEKIFPMPERQTKCHEGISCQIFKQEAFGAVSMEELAAFVRAIAGFAALRPRLKVRGKPSISRSLSPFVINDEPRKIHQDGGPLKKPPEPKAVTGGKKKTKIEE